MIQKVAIFLAALVLFAVVLSPFFIKVSIGCRSQFGGCPSEIVNQLNQFNGKNLFLARQKTSAFLSQNLLITGFSMQFKIPNTLEVNVLVKKPEFAIFDKMSGKFDLVDSDGKIISIVSNTSLPAVSVSDEKLSIGSKVSDRDFFALKLMRGIWEMYQLQSGEIQDGSLVIELPGGVTVILPQDGDTNVILGTLRLVYGKVESPEMTGKYSQIDLRFKNPVLR